MKHHVSVLLAVLGLSHPLAATEPGQIVSLELSSSNTTQVGQLNQQSSVLYRETAKVGKDRIWQNEVLVDWQSCSVQYLDDELETLSVELCEPYKELKFLVSRSHDKSYWSLTHVVFNSDHGVGHMIDRWGTRGSSSWQEQ